MSSPEFKRCKFLRSKFHDIFCLLALLASFLIGIANLADAQSITPVSLNSFIAGDTNGSTKNIYSSFTKIDIIEPPIGSGGQVIHSLEIPDSEFKTSLQISTCVGTEFDTYLVLLSGNPLTTSPTVVAESGNDITCVADERRAYLSVQLSSGTYFILVTGNGSEEGKYNLTVTGVQSTPTPIPWGLDRIDQRSLPLNAQYTISDSGETVHVYVVDSGIRLSHDEFEGRAVQGFDFINGRAEAVQDCTGHGTHVAGIIAGKNFGVAKKANLISVRVFGCNNEAKLSQIVDAIGWVLLDARINSRQNVIVTLMFSSASGESTILQSTIRGLVRSGFLVIVPAGNNAGNSCDFYPGSLDEFLTIGATDITDERSPFSNFGNCTNIYAPGGSVTSSWHTSDSSWKTVSGTAQAAAHMAGVATNFLALNGPLEADVANSIIRSISTTNIVTNVPRNVSTRFGFVRTVPGFSGAPPPSQKVFLFFILQFSSGISSCVGSSEIDSVQTFFADLLSKKKSLVTVSCDDISESSLAKNIQVRIEEDERKAAASFSILETAVTKDKTNTEDSIKLEFSVVELPWAVDSKQIIFWGAPTFSEAESSSLSGGAIAGIVIGLLCILVVIAAIAWISYRKVTKLDEVKSMEGSADFDTAPVHFNDYENNDGGANVKRSFRNVFRALSFSRTGSMRSSSSMHMGGGGYNMRRTSSQASHMESQMDGPENMRMTSFGGEAFAGLDIGSRTNSMASSAADDIPSFGSHRLQSFSLSQSSNLSTDFSAFSSRTAPNEPDINHEAFQMQSFGGEAFAAMRMDSVATDGVETNMSITNTELPEVSHDSEIEKSEPFDGEALASMRLSQTETSFFAGK